MDTATKDMVASIKTSNDVRATIDIGSHAILVRPTLTPNLSPIFTSPPLSHNTIIPRFVTSAANIRPLCRKNKQPARNNLPKEDAYEKQFLNLHAF